jgi:dsDNA-specific endonuclease/ATPase MutS2
MSRKPTKPSKEESSVAVSIEGAVHEESSVRLPIEDSIDLHVFAPRDVRSVVDEYLEEAAKAGHEEVRLIHGRGVGSQREAVRTVCARHPRVANYADATPERGGWGATIARLKRA